MNDIKRVKMASNDIIADINDLQTWCLNNNKLSILEEWDYNKNDPILPTSIAYGSNKKVWWKCPNGHSYETRVGNRTFLNRGCPYCAGKKTLEGYNDFKTWCISNEREDLLSEWDYEKNDITPSQISPKNGKKVWWKCSLGHEWESTIGSRTSNSRPSGCPYCSDPPKRVLIGFNDFESWCLKNDKAFLLSEWDKDRNTDFTPKEITYGCGKKVWWKCSRGHEWCVSPANRVQGTGCPICSRTQTSFPEQAIAYYLSKSYRILQRYRVQSFEIDIYLEEYKIGIEYDGLYFHTDDKKSQEKNKDSFFKEQGITLIRVKESKEKTDIEENTIFYIPQKSNYLDDSFNDMLISLLLRLEIMTGVKTDKDIDIVRDELAIREHYASEINKNSFASVFPELMPEWDVEKNNGITPDSFSAYSHVKVWWKCANGHSWKASISSRSRLGCPFCSGQKTITGESDLETWCKQNNPQLLSEWNYEKNFEKPSELSKTSNKKVWWKCANGHEWEAIIANRVHGTKCPYCSRLNYTERCKQSLSEWCKNNHQEHLLDEWDYNRNGILTPEMVSKASHRKVWWICSQGHEWEAQIKSRTYNHGCPYCSNTFKRPLVGKNDLVTWCIQNDRQYILDEWDYDANEGMMPEQYTFGSHKQINWKCKNGHKWSAVIKERTKTKGNMCPICKKEKC